MAESGQGVFRAVVTRDGQAAARHDSRFVAANCLETRTPDPDGALWEVQFEDGFWIMASTPDLTFDR